MTFQLMNNPAAGGLNLSLISTAESRPPNRVPWPARQRASVRKSIEILGGAFTPGTVKLILLYGPWKVKDCNLLDSNDFIHISGL